MIVFIGFLKRTADRLVANQKESIDSGKWSINHVTHGSIYTGPVSQANYVSIYRVHQSQVFVISLVGNITCQSTIVAAFMMAKDTNDIWEILG